MKLKIIKENSCTTCKHYVEHYVISSTRFLPIGGHCVNGELINPHKRDRYAVTEHCTKWESGESKREQKKKSIAEAVRAMEEHLGHIAEILRNYEE